MKWLPEWGRPRKEGNERLPPPSLAEEASIGCGRKIAWQEHFQQMLAYGIRLGVLSATQVEAAKFDAQECEPAFRHAAG